MLMLNGISREADNTDVAIVDERALQQRSMELLDELLEPTRFRYTICNTPSVTVVAIVHLQCWRNENLSGFQIQI
jgi:hypothetical protein